MNNISNNPRDPQTIKQELRELELASFSSKEWLNSHPSDNLVAILIQQDEQRKKRLLKELERSYSYYRYHHFIYAIKTTDKVEISNLSHLLTSLNGVVNATCNSISANIKSISLYFDTVIQSSFGVLLSTDWDTELIDSSIERTFNKFFDIAGNLQDTVGFANEEVFALFDNNKNLMQKFRTFYLGIANYESSISLSWGGFLQNQKRHSTIDRQEALQIYKKLVDLESPICEDVKVSGSIQGISLIDQSLQFVPHKKEGARIKLAFDKRFEEYVKPLLGEVAEIIYRISTEYDEQNDRMITSKELIEIVSLK